MASTRQERLTPGATFIDASGRTRWRSRVPGVSDVEADIGEEAEPDSSLLALTSLRNALSEEATDSSAGVSSALARFSKAAQERSAGMNERARLTREAETETFPEIRPVFLSPSLAAMPWASETDEQESTAARAAGKPKDQLRRERFLQAYQDTYGLVPPVGHPSLDGVEALRSADVASPITTASTPVRADGPGVVPGTASSTTPKPVTVASVPAKTSDIAAAIPTASSVGTKAIAPTTSTSSAPPAGTSSTVKPPPVMDGSGGDDELSSLRTRLGLQQAFEGLGSAASGKNLRTDGGVLVDRMKQIEALRAKREEQSLEQQRERATWGTSNRATLASALAQWKGDEAKTAALEALASGADTTKPSDFSRNAVNAVMTKPKVLGAEAGVEKTVEQTGVAREQKAAIPAKVEQGAGKLAETIRSNKANEEIRRQALLLKKVSDTKTADEVRAAGSDPKAAERAITRAMETAESDKLGIAGNIRDFQGLEKVAPGFTQGKVPSWLGQGSIEAARKVPALSKQASNLASALETFVAGIRKSLFGASLTGNEKASFDAIVSSGLLMPPDVLAANINRLREGAAKFAQNHFTVAQTLHPEVTSRVLGASSLFGPAVAKGGIYSDVWTLPVGPAVGPSESQIAKLRANPDKASDFDAKFGPGAAAKILGGQ